MPLDITESIPSLLSSRESTSASIANGVLWDYTIGGVGFMRWAGDQVSYRRRSIPVQKNQFDSSGDPGEQSLDGFWLRSQVSFHKGAGIKYYEPGSEKETQYRFDDSEGVDVWTPGEVKLLRNPKLVTWEAGVSTASAKVCTIANGGMIAAISNSLYYMTQTSVAPTKITFSGAVTNLIGADGDNYYFTSGTSVYLGNWISAPVVVANVPSGVNVMRRIKDRLILGIGASLYELVPDATTPPTINGSTVPLYTVKDSAGWPWTGIADGPSGFYASSQSAIYRFSLENASSGTTPKIGQAYEVARFPSGEAISGLASYLGRYLGISTTRGIRVGLISNSGDLTYGPVLIDGSGDGAIDFHGDYLWCAISPNGATYSQIYRVSISNPIGDISECVFPYANDVKITSPGSVDSFAWMDFATIGREGSNYDALAVAFTLGGGVYAQDCKNYLSEAELLSTGWIRTGRIRYGTLENKVFRNVDFTTTSTPGGTVSMSVVPDRDGDSILIAQATSAQPTWSRIGLALDSPVVDVGLQFTLNTTTTTSPVLLSYQVRALPAPARTRQVQIPVAICDTDRDRNRTQSVRVGFGWDRLRAMEELESSGQPVSVKDTISGDSFLAVVEQVDFEWQGQAAGNNGGIGHRQVDGPCLVTLRML